MARARAALQQAVKASAAALDGVRRPAPGVVVLIYHRVGGRSGLDVDLPVEEFEAQMAWLAASARVTSLDDALAALAADATDHGSVRDAASCPVVVTFDDGTADFADNALPVLVQHRIPATLYAATAFIDEGRAFPDDGTPLSWAALRDACSTGYVDVGSHTHHHVLLDRLPPNEIDDELDRSVELISTELDRGPRDFAYPKALLGSPAAERAVRARFRSAAIAGTRANPFGVADPYRLSRSPVQSSDGSRWFVRKTHGGMGFEDQLRRLINRRRYAVATT